MSLTLQLSNPSLIVLFSIAVLSLSLGVYFYHIFFQCDYVQYSSHSSWTVSAGYTSNQFAAYFFGTYLLPISIACILLFAIRLHKNNSVTSVIKQIIFLAISIAFLCTTIKSYYMAEEVLSCGIWCVGSDATSSGNHYGAIYSMGMLYFIISFAFLILFTGLFIVTSFSTSKQNNDISYHDGATSPNEADRLISGQTAASSQILTVESQQSSESKSIMIQKYISKQKLLNKNNYIFLLFTFLILYPILFIACISLPTWWYRFTKYNLQVYEADQPSKSYGFYWAIVINDNLILKIFPDIFVYYLSIYIVTIIALLSQINQTVRKFLHKRPFNSLGSMVISLFCYWYYNHCWEQKLNSTRTNAELAARSVGQISNLLVGLLLLPMARNSIWSIVFGVSSESLLIWHQYLGGAFVFSVVIHMFLWWKAFANNDSFPSDILSIPMTFHADNFTKSLL
eukprot:gene5895-8134_t